MIKIETNSNLDSLGKWLPNEGEDEESWKVDYWWGKAMQRKHVFLDVIEKEAANLYYQFEHLQCSHFTFTSEDQDMTVN